MSAGTATRKLAVIMSIDMVGFSSLAQRGEPRFQALCGMVRFLLRTPPSESVRYAKRPVQR